MGALRPRSATGSGRFSSCTTGGGEKTKYWGWFLRSDSRRAGVLHLKLDQPGVEKPLGRYDKNKHPPDGQCAYSFSFTFHPTPRAGRDYHRLGSAACVNVSMFHSEGRFLLQGTSYSKLEGVRSLCGTGLRRPCPIRNYLLPFLVWCRGERIRPAPVSATSSSAFGLQLLKYQGSYP